MKKFSLVITAVALAGFGCKETTSQTAEVVDASPVIEFEEVVEVEVEVPEEIPVVVESEGYAHVDESDVDHISIARGKMSTGNTEEAVTELEMALYDNPDSFEGYYLLGQVFQTTGELEQAAWAYREASALRPGDLDVLTLRAQLLLDVDPEEGQTVCETLIELSPTNPEGYRLLARTFSKRDMWNETIGANKKAIDLGDESPFTFNNMGYAQLVMGNYGDAIDSLRIAVDSEDATHFMWNNLGLAYEKNGELNESFVAYSRALQIKENYVNAKVNLNRLTVVAADLGIVLGERVAATDEGGDLPVISEEILPVPEDIE